MRRPIITKLHIRVILAKSWAKKMGYDQSKTEEELKNLLYCYVDACYAPPRDYKFIDKI